MLELRPAVESDAGNPSDGELDRQDVSLLSVRIVTRCAHDGAHRTVREGLGVEPGSVQRGAVVPARQTMFFLTMSLLLLELRASSP